MSQKNDNPVWVFFGTSNFSVIVLDELKAKGFLPELIITVEDKPKGRKLTMTSPPVKVWAEKEGIKYIQPKSLRKPEVEDEINSYGSFDIFITASYGKIIPQNILDIPKHKTLNVHPSLLPKLRGASPIQSAILGENETGISILSVDAEVDHGPIVAQKKIEIEWPPYAADLEKELGKAGGELLAHLLSDWTHSRIEGQEQNHELATFCKKIEKEDGQINLTDSPEINLRKIRAYHVWPGTYFFDSRGKRIIVKRAHIENGELTLDRIVPEGKKEMGYIDFLKGRKN